MRVYKEKQYLVFDYEDGKTVKYDFATKKAIGLKGQPVKDLKSQLQGLRLEELFDSFDDQKYAKFLKFIQRQESWGYPISNIGTILDRVPKYSYMEQIYSAGFEDIVIYDKHEGFKYGINDIPKSLVKVAKNNKVKISNRAIKYWKENPDAHYIGYNLEFITLDDEDINNIWMSDEYRNRTEGYVSYFNMLIHNFGYNAKALFLYIDTLKTFEALEDMRFVMKELYDYARMMNVISPKYDKYPRNFLTTHKIACRNYNRLKKEFPEDLFKKRINKNYEYIYRDYKFIYPDCVQDIKDEAVQQNNCVASYIDGVIDGRCHIMFLRKKDSLDKSLVTLEIVNNQIVQAKRRFNEPVTAEDQEAIDKWNKKFAEKGEAA